MSGFDIAGLVLAVIPLVVEGLKSYPVQKVCRTVKSFKEFQEERRAFAQELRYMNTELRYIIFQAILTSGSITPDQVQVLSSPDSHGSSFFDVWVDVTMKQSESMDNALKQTIEAINDTLEDIQELFKEMLQLSGLVTS